MAASKLAVRRFVMAEAAARVLLDLSLSTTTRIRLEQPYRNDLVHHRQWSHCGLAGRSESLATGIGLHHLRILRCVSHC